MEDNSIDTVITDPPYHLVSINKRFSKTSPNDDNKTAEDARNGAHQYARLSSGFMGKEWDGGGIAFDPATWAEVLRVAKPGAILLAFGGTRTFHRLTCAIEDAGWIIRDCVMWLYGSGFPKSLDISKAIDKRAGAEREVVGQRPIAYSDSNCWSIPNKNDNGDCHNPSSYNRPGNIENGKRPITTPATDAARLWDGWGSSLKPAWEPIILAMKPLDGTFAENALRWGVAGLNVDGARVGTDEKDDYGRSPNRANGTRSRSRGFSFGRGLNEDIGISHPQGRWPANLILSDDPEVTAGFPVTGKSSGGLTKAFAKNHRVYGKPGEEKLRQNAGGLGDSGSAARYFYCAKASKRERNHGLPDGMTNKHPTVKPISLCRYLAKLTKTPTCGIVLDPFCGSGSIGVAAILEGRQFIGIDQDADSVEVARYRLSAAEEEASQPEQLELID